MKYMVPETLISGFGIQMDQRFFPSFPPKIFAIGIWLLFNVTLIKQIKNHQILAHWWRPTEFFLSLIIPPKTRFLGTRLDGDDLYPLLSQIDRNKNFQTIFKMSWVKEKCIIIAWGLFYISIVQRIYLTL